MVGLAWEGSRQPWFRELGIHEVVNATCEAQTYSLSLGSSRSELEDVMEMSLHQTGEIGPSDNKTCVMSTLPPVLRRSPRRSNSQAISLSVSVPTDSPTSYHADNLSVRICSFPYLLRLQMTHTVEANLADPRPCLLLSSQKF
jgi:hypothetical protein